jgi:hypothetical protein
MEVEFSDSPFPSSPISYTTAPDITLTRIGRNNDYILWRRDTHELFLSWWNTTTWVIGQPTITYTDLGKQIGWNSLGRKSTVWHQYDQAAHYTHGDPVVICRRCQSILSHPNVKKIGSSSLSKHLLSAICQRSSPPGSQESIRRFTQVSQGWITIKITIS